MREILFRGKRIDGGGWVEGDLARRKSRFAPQLNTTYGISDAFGVFCAVDPETVGQYTGLTDKNGKRIFEGDICNCRKFECVGKIEWCEYDASFDFYVLCGGGVYDSENLYDYADELEIIGNCYDNPELLEVES